MIKKMNISDVGNVQHDPRNWFFSLCLSNFSHEVLGRADSDAEISLFLSWLPRNSSVINKKECLFCHKIYTKYCMTSQ